MEETKGLHRKKIIREQHRIMNAIDDWAEVGAMLKAGELKLGGSPRIRPWALRIAWLAAAAAAGAFAAQALF